MLENKVSVTLIENTEYSVVVFNIIKDKEWKKLNAHSV
jgi:hypothetical protein